MNPKISLFFFFKLWITFNLNKILLCYCISNCGYHNFSIFNFYYFNIKKEIQIILYLNHIFHLNGFIKKKEKKEKYLTCHNTCGTHTDN